MLTPQNEITVFEGSPLDIVCRSYSSFEQTQLIIYKDQVSLLLINKTSIFNLFKTDDFYFFIIIKIVEYIQAHLNLILEIH